ncbi:AAA family ATPase, partial [Acinetobacter baumannii]|nr:AAA family ATPase [Acinetobacter baumannii]
VFHFDFNGENFTIADTLEIYLNVCLARWEREYDITPMENESLGSRFEHIIQVAYEKSGRGVVVLVDEYDKPLLDVL